MHREGFSLFSCSSIGSEKDKTYLKHSRKSHVELENVKIELVVTKWFSLAKISSNAYGKNAFNFFKISFVHLEACSEVMIQ